MDEPAAHHRTRPDEKFLTGAYGHWQRRRWRRRAAALVACALAGWTHIAAASGQARQSREDAWWTGPLLTAGATPLPRGRFLIEPYLFDIDTYARYDRAGSRHDISDSHFVGSQSYVLYGVTDRFTAGFIPRFGFVDLSTGADSSGVRVGDLTLQLQYGLTQFQEGRRVPTTSFVLQQTLPVAKYDRLGDRPADGIGAGAYTTSLALHSQTFLWMPNGRILRARLNLSYAFSDEPSLQDVSVYGTPQGFRGHAEPGDSFMITSGWEYSATRNWVLALDAYYQHDETTRVRGQVAAAPGAPQAFEAEAGSSWQAGLAPALEYNWNSRVGLIFGLRWIAAGRNTNASITPAVALNMVY